MNRLPVLDSPDALVARHDALAAETEGRLFPSDAARLLGVSELALVAARVGHGATRLSADFATVLGGLATLGPVKAITRNEHAVLEVVGAWSGLELGPHHGLVLGGPIDLRLFPRRFAQAFAVESSARGRTSRSIQLFGADGRAVHKVFVTGDEGAVAFDAFVARHASGDDSRTAPVAADAQRAVARPGPVDRERFEADWRAMKETHEFHGVLARHQVSRREAVELVPHELARRVAGTALSDALLAARELEVPLMVFVGNPGCIQIHTGRLERIVSARGWLNVLDPGVDLHVREASIDAVFAVRRPAEEGRWVSSLEVYAADGELVLSLFGERKPGRDELPEWRAIHASLLPHGAHAEGAR